MTTYQQPCHVVPSSCVEPPLAIRRELHLRQSRSIPQIPLGKHRANLLRDYDVTSHLESDLETMSRWSFEGVLDDARLKWHRAKKEQIAADLDFCTRFGLVEELATSNRWGARL